MNNRRVGMIATAATALLCGFPGLIGLCVGVIFAAVSQIPGAEIDIGGSSDPQSALLFGLAGICVGIVLILIPIAVGFFTLRKRQGGSNLSEEPLPPAY